MRTLIERKAANFMKDPFTLERGAFLFPIFYSSSVVSLACIMVRGRTKICRFLISSLHETFHIKGITFS